MRAGEFVSEIGDSPAEHEPNRRRRRSLFHATVDGHWVDVFFDRSDLNGTLHITFTVNDNYEAPKVPTRASGSTIKILSTVLDIIRQRLPEYIRSARPPAVSFTAQGDKRAALYRKYFVPVVQDILGSRWELTEYPTMGMTVFNWRTAKQDRTGINEIGAPGELDVSEKLQRYFTDRGYDIAGEGRDQMVFHRPGQRHVVKVIGLGDDLARRDNVADYVRFFAMNQRNPHFPRVSQPREIQIGDEIYTIYRQELLQGLPGEEEVMDWMEKFGAALSDPARARAWVRENPPPPNLPRQQVQGLYTAVRRLQQFYGDDLGGSIRLDLGHTGNFMQRADGTIVVVDPLAYDESYDTYSESAPVANEDLAGTLKKGLAGAALAGTMAMGSPAVAAEPLPMTTVAVVTIDGETRQYNLGTRFKSSREALQFVDDVLKRQGLSGYDINIRRGVAKTNENFADGKNPGRKGLSKRVGVSQKMSIARLKKIASTATGERRRMAQWNLNMKRGRNKS